MRYVALTLLLASLLTGCNEVASSPEPAALLSEQPDPFLEGSTPRVRLTVLEGTKDAPAIGTARVRIEARWDSVWARSRDTALIVGASTPKNKTVLIDYNGELFHEEMERNGNPRFTKFETFGLTEINEVVDVPCADTVIYIFLTAYNFADSTGVQITPWDGSVIQDDSYFSEQTIYCGK